LRTVLRFCANLSLLFRELPLRERIGAAQAQGFRAVEIQLPYELPARELAAAADEAGIAFVLINAPLGPDPRAPGMACRAEHGDAFRTALERAAEYAAALRVPCVNVLAGRALPDEQSACLELLAERLALAAEILAPAGAQALLEPINPLDAPSYCVPSFEIAARVFAATDPRVRLQFDVYHAARMGLEPAQVFAKECSRIAHIQFADCPGRHEPGTGRVAFPEVFAAIRDSAYRGWVGAEYHPAAATADGLAWLRRYSQDQYS
jgi:hydroxypyruvate isomerase